MLYFGEFRLNFEWNILGILKLLRIFLKSSVYKKYNKLGT